jgi:hypothetical protein
VFKTIRVVVLVFVLVLVAVGSWQTRQRLARWELPVRAVVYPIAGDESEATRKYVRDLTAETFRPIETFIDEEARSFGVEPKYGQPLRVQLAPEVKSLPPPPPIGGNLLEIMAWSLKLRYWAWTADTWTGSSPDVQLFVVYHEPAPGELPHSLGLEQGRIGVANVFASSRMAGQNNVVIAHELLHTLGASDKYDERTAQPRFPDGYAKPEAEPRYPQRFAEIMAGRIPISESDSEIPPSLNATLVGEATAREIAWLR